MDILTDMGVSKLSAKAFSKVNYSFKLKRFIIHIFIMSQKTLILNKCCFF